MTYPDGSPLSNPYSGSDSTQNSRFATIKLRRGHRAERERSLPRSGSATPCPCAQNRAWRGVDISAACFLGAILFGLCFTYQGGRPTWAERGDVLIEVRLLGPFSARRRGGAVTPAAFRLRPARNPRPAPT